MIWVQQRPPSTPRLPKHLHLSRTARAKHDATSHTRNARAPQDWASLPWDLSMPYDQAARVLGAWAGPSTAGLKSGEVLPLDTAQMTEILAETTARGNKELEAALYAHADSVTRAFFGDDVYCGWRPVSFVFASGGGCVRRSRGEALQASLAASRKRARART